ncbi:MAG: PTS system mannose/fructose/sorbose family transporter subunit IID [Candidatus Firestonebacteria bacterium]|nr:PTS system mannose/fructose/sorbose family transporter subunit IID [Candidatus Firestonebacteria bacterium]
MYKLIKRTDLLKILFRSLLIEASWNFEAMQNIGFTYGLLPAGKRLYKTREERAAFLKRHLKFFNTHPAMAPAIMGVVINMEERHKLGEAGALEQIEGIKTSMMGPLAAIGDNVFWEYLRPFSAVVGVSIVMLFKDSNHPYLALLGPLVTVIIYNAINAFVRYRGLVQGYERGVDILSVIRGFNLTALIDKLKFSSALILGLTVALIFPTLNIRVFGADILNSLLFLGVTLLFFGMLKIKIFPTVIFYSIIAAAILFKYIL